MLTLLFSLSLLTLESLSFGHFALRVLERNLVKKELSEPKMRLLYALILGYVLIAGIAQLVSLKTNLGLKVEIGFALASLLFGMVIFHSLLQDIRILNHSLSYVTKTCLLLGCVALILVSLGPTYTVDTYGYHAQTMRWLEDVGTAKGIANIHMRLGYNSAMYVMSALFSFKELFEYPVRVINCFWALVSGGVALVHIMNIRSHRFHFGDGIAAGTLWYLFDSWSEWSGISNRTCIAVLMLLIALLWVRVCEGLDKESAYFFITLLIVYATTVKLNVAALGILCVVFLFKLIKEKECVTGLCWTAINALTAGGWFIRNIFISGYLIYPLYQIDLFNVDWKVPLDVAIRDSNDIIVFARRGPQYYDICLTAFRWIPLWIEGMWSEKKLFLISTVFAVSGIIVLFVLCCCRIQKYARFVLFGICYFALFLYWFFAAPAEGFGWGVTLIGCGMLSGVVLDCVIIKRIVYLTDRIPRGALAVSLTVSMLALAMVSGYWKDNLLYQADWFNYNYESLELQDYVKIYYPCDEASEGKAGYYAFPATNDRATLQHLEARGVYITDGFRTNMNINHF